MEEEAYRRRGIAAEVSLSGEIEGRIIFDVDQKDGRCTSPAAWPASELPETDEIWCGRRCVNSPTRLSETPLRSLNDQGFHFRVHPPTVHTSEQGSKSSEDTEALVICFGTESGKVFMNVALRYHRRRAMERAAVI